MKPKSKEIKSVKELLKNRRFLIQLIMKDWNAETPHFGGIGPHRYDGNEKECSYCLRPKDWKPVAGSGYFAELFDEAIAKRGAK